MATKKDEVKTIAVVEIGKEQYLVNEGLKIKTKKLKGDKGEKFDSDKVLFIAVGEKIKVGKPYIKGAKVSFEIASQAKSEKVVTKIFKAKSRYRKTRGKKVLFTELIVKKILSSAS